MSDKKNQAQQQEPLPCPFCGNSGLDFDEGSTYRWGIASCSGCGASCGEIRREYPDKGQWHKEAIAEWNRRTSPQPSKPWVGLTSEQIKKLETAAGFALEVLVKHRQMMGEYPMGMLGVNAAEKLEEAFREINEAYRDDIANLRQAIEAKLREKNELV